MVLTKPQFAQAYCPLQSEQLENPYSFYAQARQQNIFSTDTLLEDGTPVYVVTRFEDAHSILSHPERFSSKDTLRPVTSWSPETMAILAQGYAPTPIHLNTDGEAHKRFRKPLSQAFLPSRIADLEEVIRSHAYTLLDAYEEARCLDVITDFAYPLTLDVILSLFDLPAEDRAQAKHWCNQWLTLVSARLTKKSKSLLLMESSNSNAIWRRSFSNEASSRSLMISSPTSRIPIAIRSLFLWMSWSMYWVVFCSPDMKRPRI